MYCSPIPDPYLSIQAEGPFSTMPSHMASTWGGYCARGDYPGKAPCAYVNENKGLFPTFLDRWMGGVCGQSGYRNSELHFKIRRPLGTLTGPLSM